MSEAVLVTGASSGIGLVTANLLAAEGYTVFAGVRKESDREQLAGYESIRPVILDVTVPADLTRAAATIEASGLPLAGVVNNAGVVLVGPLEFLPLEEIRRQYEINVYGPIAVAQAMLPLLRVSTGRMVFVGSIAGRLSAPFVGPYSSSKAALASLVDALRQELAPSDIRVSLLEFASVRTPIWAKGRADKERLVSMMPPTAMTYYGSIVDAMVQQSRSEEKEGMDPSIVARSVLHALRSPHPRERYLIGHKAKIRAVAAVLPPGMRDKLIRSAMQRP